MKTKFLLFLFAAFTLLSGCSRVQSGHAGLRQYFDGTIEKTAYEPGLWYSGMGSIHELAANEITVTLSDLHPQTKDKSVIEDLSVVIMYKIQTDDLAKLYIDYRNRHDTDPEGVIYPMFKYVVNISTSALSDAIAQRNALDANLDRNGIIKDIKEAMAEKLKSEGLEKMIIVKEVIINHLNISKVLQASAENVIRAQNELNAKTFEVQTATKEAQRMDEIAKGITPTYLAYMHAQSDLIRAQAYGDAIKSGKVPNWMIVPDNFTAVGNMATK